MNNMQTAPIKQKKVLQEEVPCLILPENWWTTNYSYEYYSEGNNSEVQLFKIEPPTKDEFEFHRVSEKIIKSPMNDWNYSSGDYYVNESNFKNKAINQNFNNRFANNFLYIGIAFAVFITLLVMNTIVSL